MKSTETKQAPSIVLVGGRTHILSNEVQRSLKNRISGLLEDAGVDDWDGEGALALQEDTVEMQRRSLMYYPITLEYLMFPPLRMVKWTSTGL